MQSKNNQLGNQKITSFLTYWLSVSCCATTDNDKDNQNNQFGRVERPYVLQLWTVLPLRKGVVELIV